MKISKKFILIKNLLNKLPEIIGGISKRRKIFLSAIFLAMVLLITQWINFSWHYQAVGLLALFTFILSTWSLFEGLNGIEWLTVLTLPTLFTIGIGLFYFLTPTSWLTRLPVIFFFGIGIYALLLIENIFSVAAIRTIQLLRSAQAVGFLFTLLTAFFLYDTVLSFRLDAWFNFILVLLISFFLILQGLWCITLEKKISRQILTYTLVLSLVQAEIGLAFSFWPVAVTVGSLALTTVLYTTLGLAQHRLSERLFQRTINEYLSVAVVVLVTIFFTTHWGG